jgi:alkylation response protein AidB-like acyl-CoA dehydrogenase
VAREPYPPATGAAGDRRQGVAGDPAARADPPVAREPPGPEGSILKLFGSELALRIADFSSTLLGPYATVDAPTEAVPDAARWHHRVLGARQYTIAGGTSEIQRNIIGERVLGLPKG